jgi:uncharacterized protein YndB with AHSA1/START domain
MDDRLGQLEQVGESWRLRFVRRLPHPPAKVWRALTEPDHLVAWFPTTIDGERAAGAKLRFEFPFDEAPGMDGEMVTYDPPSTMELRWGDETLRFDLEPDGDGARAGTILTFVTTFDELGKAARDAAGWHGCLDILGYEVGGDPLPWPPQERWAQLNPLYVEALPPEASTIGPPDWHPEADR